MPQFPVDDVAIVRMVTDYEGTLPVLEIDYALIDSTSGARHGAGIMGASDWSSDVLSALQLLHDAVRRDLIYIHTGRLPDHTRSLSGAFPEKEKYNDDPPTFGNL